MITARKLHSFATSARTIVLAGSLMLASVLPTASLVYADAGITPTAMSEPALSAEQAFDVDPAGGLVGIEAVVVADTAGAPLLEEPALDSSVIRSLPHGTTVVLRIDTLDSVYSASGEIRWWPVTVDGTSGWIDGRSLMSPQNFSASSGKASASDTSTTRQPFDFTGELIGAQAQVDADGEGLKMRSEPDANAEVLASISEGTIIDLRIADVDTVYDSAGTRWWPVTYNGIDGWVSGFYLIHPGAQSQAGTAPQTSPSAPQTTDPSGDFVYVAGDWAVVRTSNEGRANLYSSNNTAASVNGTIPHMALVEVLAQADGGWYEVRWDTIQGFIQGDYLTAGTAPRRANDAVDPAPQPTAAAVSTEEASSVEIDPLIAGDVAQINSESGAGVNVRSAAGITSDAVGFLADGNQVDVLAGPSADAGGENWYQIRSQNGVEGWVRADLLAQAVASTESASAASTEVSDAGWILPLASYRFTQDYGCSNLGFYSYDPNWGCAVHDGVDMAAPQGTPLLAVADGTVVVSGWCDCGLGYYVEIDHGNGLHTVYGHMASQPPVRVGQQVSQGETIGPLGSTGLSTGPHVHFMVRENGVTVDPKNYLPPIGSSGN